MNKHVWSLLTILLLLGCSPTDEIEENLLSAAEDGNTQVLKSLLASGATVDDRDECRFTPLMKAALNGHVEIVDRLLAFGAEVEAMDKAGYTPLLLAASNGHVSIVEKLLNAGANVNHVEHSNGWTALIIGARRGDEGMVDLLLAHGADLQHKDSQGLNALLWAARLEHEAVAGMLVQRLKAKTT